MTLADAGVLVSIGVGVVGAVMGLVGFLRAEQLRKQGTTEQTRKLVDAIDRRVEILELQLEPLFKVMRERLSSMFHMPHREARELDALIEKFDADDTDLKWSVQEEELNRLVMLIDRQIAAMAQQPGEIEAHKDMWMGFVAASVKGIYNARVRLRQREEVEQPHRDRLVGFLWQPHEAETPRESWWARLKNFLRGSSSS